MTMTADDQIARLKVLLAAFFRLARQQHQARGIEKKGSESKPATQQVHPFDQMVDVVCKDLGLPNPGTDEHSLKCFPHPVEGWPPEKEEDMRLTRVWMGLEKARKGDVYVHSFGHTIKLYKKDKSRDPSCSDDDSSEQDPAED